MGTTSFVITALSTTHMQSVIIIIQHQNSVKWIQIHKKCFPYIEIKRQTQGLIQDHFDSSNVCSYHLICPCPNVIPSLLLLLNSLIDSVLRFYFQSITFWMPAALAHSPSRGLIIMVHYFSPSISFILYLVKFQLN